MQIDKKFWQCAAGINGFIAVVMGAIAAHAIADPHMAAMAEKASLYQLIHAVLLLWLADRKGRFSGFARHLFLVGIILFCGTLYIKALTGWALITKLAPTGGMSFMAGWLMIAIASYKDKA